MKPMALIIHESHKVCSLLQIDGLERCASSNKMTRKESSLYTSGETSYPQNFPLHSLIPHPY